MGAERRHPASLRGRENATKRKKHLRGVPKDEQQLRWSCVTLGNLTNFSELQCLYKMVVGSTSQALGEDRMRSCVKDA